MSPLWLSLPVWACVAAMPADVPLVDTWRFTLERPVEGWDRPDFDDSSWRRGSGGFGRRGTPGARLGTPWTTSDIWLRKTIAIEALPRRLALWIHHDEEVEISVNGRRLIARPGYTTDYERWDVPDELRSAFRVGENLLAVHCHQTTGGQFIDVHVIDADRVPELPPARRDSSALRSTTSITRWGADVTPENAWTEYPRPQMVRDEWSNLNGRWQYAVTSAEVAVAPDRWDGEILVPFCLESRLGGVQRYLDPDQALWYRRSVPHHTVPDRRVLLHFEAVDHRCEVLVNGERVGVHEGGNTPFEFDISTALRDGDNELIVRVEDDTGGWQLRGKQVLDAEGIWYTSVSGIWQTVWLEEVPTTSFRDLKIVTDASRGTIAVTPAIVGANGARLRLRVLDAGALVAEETAPVGRIEVVVPRARLWSPSDPHLYDLELELVDSAGERIDRIVSYTGIRTIGKRRGADGHWRMTLNGADLFHWGTLDQGWWPDGLLTPPSDDAMRYDLEFLKAAGFNMLRKHIKVEPRRYYTHCDRLGLLVWQDQVSGGRTPPWTQLQDGPRDADWPDAAHAQFLAEFEAMVDTLENHPAIAVWVPFNEAWGQHRTLEVGRWIRDRDPSRLVDIASGGNFWPIGDLVDAHSYPSPGFPFDAERDAAFVKVVGEFGGHGFAVEGHLWDPSQGNWGYGGLPRDTAEYRARYLDSIRKLAELRGRGIAGAVYTQTTDVEG
ncbi:MAG: glycoside hydrolase family 2, partial [Planctomycetes bacterium]|nr:glycoside hydrolase family 2 [Planctomycetota bacterium]